MFIFLACLNILLALWVWADSNKTGTNKIVFTTLTLLTGLVGWLVYMIKREERKINVDNRS